MRGHQLPVGIPGHQGVGDLGVQAAAHAGRRQLRGDLAKQLVTESPTDWPPSLEHSRLLEFAENAVEYMVAEIDNGAEQAAVHLAADECRRLHYRYHVRARPQPGEQGLVQTFRHSGLREPADDLLDVERHPVAAVGHRRASRCREIGIQGGDQSVNLVPRQWVQVDQCHWPVGGQPRAEASRHHHEQPALGGIQQRPDSFDGGRVEPVRILDHHHARASAETGQEIVLNCLSDQFIEFTSLCGSGLVSVFRCDVQHRRQQRHRDCRIQSAGHQLGFEQPQPLSRRGQSADAATLFEQAAYRVQTGVSVQRRSRQCQHHRPRILGQSGGGGRQPRLADPRLATQHHPRSPQGAGLSAHPSVL